VFGSPKWANGSGSKKGKWLILIVLCFEIQVHVELWVCDGFVSIPTSVRTHVPLVIGYTKVKQHVCMLGVIDSSCLCDHDTICPIHLKVWDRRAF
jgi:hypothetical protein